MKRESVQIHGVTLALTPEGTIEAAIGDETAPKTSDSVESILLFFLLREIQALNGALREARPFVSRGSAPRAASSPGIFPP